MLNLTEQEVSQLVTLSAQLSALLGKATDFSLPGWTAAAGCNNSCEGGCTGCMGCSGACNGCGSTSGSTALAPLSVDDMVRVFDNLDTLGTIFLSPEVLNQALLQKSSRSSRKVSPPRRQSRYMPKT